MNSFDHPRGEVHYEAFRAEDVLPALARAEAGALDALDQVPTHPDPLWAFGEASAAYDFIVTIVDDMVGVLGGAWHDVARAADERAARFWTTVCQRRNLYDAIRAVAPSGPVEERLRADLLRRFEHAGAHLDAVDRDRLTAVKARLAELASDFAANLRAADAASGVATDDPAGLPDALVAAAREAAADRGLPDFYVPYSEQNAIVVLGEAENRPLREKMYRLTIARAAVTNGPVVADILALRRELAELLGYADFVELHRAGRMVAEPQALLDELAAAYQPQADREHADLLAFARAYTGDDTLELTAADVDNPLDGFYATKLRESLGLASAASVSVPVETARQVMLDALAELYSVTFTRSDASGWHTDVEAFDLRDASGRHLARIFCDWWLRDGKRPFGGWMSGPYLATDGGPHVVTVVANVPPAGANLLQLRIMWHEFGHALHFAFTRTRYRQRSPDDGPRDFIEGPSRIMENWPLDPEILRRMGVAEDAAEAARAEDRFRTASRRMTRLVRPAIDLALHRGEDPLPVKQRHLPVPVDPADATATQFHHIFAGEYGASHYAYQWAGVMDADLFTRFAAEGILNPATGRDYAERVLAPGAERDPADLIRDFLGRDVTMRALLDRDGVAGT
ncbi:MAG TPA: M3 family metallopeptidase [Jatrophihabitantaceae bacterium]|nr:M3 family metallopeptidase [Jatrophihabitantaceae bacterium]